MKKYLAIIFLFLGLGVGNFFLANAYSSNLGAQDASNNLQDQKREPIMLDVLDLKNTDIIDVLKLISKKSGLNIVTGKDVKGRVNIYLKDIELRDALEVILDSYGLAFIEEEKFIRVLTEKDFQSKYGYKFGENLETRFVQLIYSDAVETAAFLTQMKSFIGMVISDKNSNSVIIKDTPEQLIILENVIKSMDVPRTTEVFNLYHARAEDIASKITEMLTRNVGRLEVDERSNKIIVTDIPAKIDRIEEIILSLDEREKEVRIEAKIFQVILSDEYKMGVDWEAIVPEYKGLDLTGDYDILEASDKRGKVSIGTLATDNYSVILEALEEVGETNILSNPRITVLNNKEAKILVGSNEPYITSTTVTPSTGTTTTSESINFIEVGVKLYVTPTIHRDDFITMKIKPEVSSVVKTITTSSNNSIPVVETSEAETTVMVKNEATIVIGGLIKDEKIISKNQIPLLGDIPLLGMVFSNSKSTDKKTELVIFLTPIIISGDSDQYYGFLEDFSKEYPHIEKKE